jgi:hypothetical protein
MTLAVCVSASMKEFYPPVIAMSDNDDIVESSLISHVILQSAVGA